MKMKYKSVVLESIHSSARALYKVGAIDAKTMKEFDEGCLKQPSSKVKAKRKTQG